MGKGRCIAVLGTASDVGKSLVVTALCRLFRRRGLRVAPFKAQNMSNNSFVTTDGGEMGRAQVVQAEAAGVEPRVEMNPVLLKPSGDDRSQVVILGKARGDASASAYFKHSDTLFDVAARCLDDLRSLFDAVVIEGAGSCAEMNLMDRDFVNFRMARYADAPVILVADIGRGGVFAQVIGTLEVLPPSCRRMIEGIVINGFRGDASLFRDGVDYLRRRAGVPVLGVLPYFDDLYVDAEDGVVLDALYARRIVEDDAVVRIGVVHLPRVSNFTDFAPLWLEPRVSVEYLRRPVGLEVLDAVIVPGTKNTRADLAWVKSHHWNEALRRYLDHGGTVVGICGGYQMLGRIVDDTEGIEGQPGTTEGIGFLDVETVMCPDKVLCRTQGRWAGDDTPVEGYEIHMGISTVSSGVPPAFVVTSRNGVAVDDTDGAVGRCGRVWGTYLHGFFEGDEFRHSFLAALADGGWKPSGESFRAFKERQYDLLADRFEEYVDVGAVLEMLG